MKITKFTVCLLFLAVLFLTPSCKDGYDDSELTGRVENLENRVQKLEEQMNSNISSLQAILEALDNNDYITKVVPITNGEKEIGYTIHFSKGNSINIYHGQDGEDGQDGYTPKIGVKQDVDGIYYWTLDGEWMIDESGNKIKTQGLDGQDGEDGQDGQDGAPGENGQDGQDGITPQFKIEDDYWWVSYNNGASWEKLGQATGEDATSIFKEVTKNDKEVIFTLNDDTTIVIPIVQKIEISFDYDGDEVGISEGRTLYINYTLKNASDDVQVTASSDGNFIIKVEANGKTGGRISVKCINDGTDGYINVIVNDGNGYSYLKVINIYKNKIEFVNGLEYKISALGGDVMVPISLNFDYEVEVVEGDSWITVNPVSRAAMRDEVLSFSVAENSSSAERHAKVQLYNPANKEEIYAEVMIGQSGISDEDVNAMIVEVRANYGNNFTTYLPLWGNLDCYVDWGDGNIEYFEGYHGHNEVTHKYSVSYPTSFEVKIKGKVPYISSSNLANHSITDVKQWGNLGVTSMSFAFYNNSLLKSIPDDILGAFENVSTFNYAFSGCSSLVVIPEGLFDNCPNVTSFNYTFSNCTSLTTIPENLFDNCPNVASFTQTFYACSSLTTIPEGLFDNCPNVTSLTSTFSHCTSLATIPESLFDNCPNATSFEYTFSHCTSLATIPESLFDNCPNVICFNYTFSDCTSLTTIPESLFYYNRKVAEFENTFYNCSNLKGESPYTVIDGVKYHLYDRYKNKDHFFTPTRTSCCFTGCYGLDDYEDIPKSWVSSI